nr:fibrinogen-like protein 1-like protein [Anolis sagrei ordinatus]
MANKVPGMLCHLALCLCFFVHGGLAITSVTRDELLSKIGNKHMIANKDIATLINGKNPVISEEYLARDCRGAYRHGRRKSGLYVIRPRFSPLLVVYCDMEYDGGGWTVLLRNDLKQKTTWSHNWNDYRIGFGDLLGNYWLGNEHIFHLTRSTPCFVRFVIIDGDGNIKHADYHSFRVDGEDNDFALRLGNYSGNAGDALTSMGEAGIHDNMKFSAQDRDNDRRPTSNCALENGAGWWYDNCYSALLTNRNQIYWEGLCTETSNCKLASIMIKPNGKNCNIPSRY